MHWTFILSSLALFLIFTLAGAYTSICGTTHLDWAAGRLWRLLTRQQASSPKEAFPDTGEPLAFVCVGIVCTFLAVAIMALCVIATLNDMAKWAA